MSNYDEKLFKNTDKFFSNDNKSMVYFKHVKNLIIFIFILLFFIKLQITKNFEKLEFLKIFVV